MEYKTDFKRSDENSQDPLNNNFKLLEKLLEDTGWLPLTLKDGYSWTTSNPGQYRVKSGVVYFRGQLARSNITKGVFATIPTNYAPATMWGAEVGQTGSAVDEAGRVYIKPNGDIELVAVSARITDVWITSIFYPLG